MAFTVLYRHTFKNTGGDDWDFKRFRDKGVALKFARRIRKNGGEAILTNRKVTAADLRSHKSVYSGKKVHWGGSPTPYQPFYDGEHMTRVNSAERRRGRRWKKRMDHTMSRNERFDAENRRRSSDAYHGKYDHLASG
jgi:hypothetical protein